MSNSSSIKIIADIGGTNLRIAITDSNNVINNISVYKCNEYSGLKEIVSDYIAKQKLGTCEIFACFAIACPVENDLISMTNLPWSFYKSELQASLNIKHLHFINDYTAIAHAVPLLSDTQKVKIGEGEAVEYAPISICGPGTGLGVANLIHHKNEWVSISGEGGHADFAPTDPLEIKILEHLLTLYPHVSYEQLLSGLGLEQIYQAILSIKGIDSSAALSAPDITQKAIDKECELCVATVNIFCRILGAFSGNLALTLGSFGGVYIAGGIVPRFIDFLKQSEFRQSFEHKGRFKAFNSKIPTYVITESQPGLLGAAAFLNQVCD